MHQLGTKSQATIRNANYNKKSNESPLRNWIENDGRE
jgi:hypothetical protein